MKLNKQLPDSYMNQILNKIDKVESNVSELNSNVTESLPFKLGIDANGNYGYIKAGADSVTPFKLGNELSIGCTATAADITVGKTALCNGQIITGTRPAAPNTLSGKWSQQLTNGYYNQAVKITFNPSFDVVPKVSYTFNGRNTTCTVTETTRDYILFNLYHAHGNDKDVCTITWTATVQ